MIEFLDQSDVARFLLARGLLAPRDVVDGDLEILDASRRNRVFVVNTSSAAYVVKQADPGGTGGVEREAALLRALERVPALAQSVPRVVEHDPRASVLVLRTRPGAVPWPARARTRARELGRILATLHELPLEVGPSPDDAMWGLSLPEPPHDLLLALSAGAQEVVARLQARAWLCARLTQLRERRDEDRVVHGDLRWENCLALPTAGARDGVLLVDWELGGRGEPAFDLAGVMAEHLRMWVGSIAMVDARDPARMLRRAQYPLRRAQPAAQAFWHGYRRARPDRPPSRLVVELTAVRLLQTAVERAQALTAPSPHVMALVQLAANLLRDPDDAARCVLGLAD